MDYAADSSKTSLRRVNKPLLERKRRARINACLNQLKTIVLKSLHKDTAKYSRLEKADILEMTVDYMKAVRLHQLRGSQVTRSHLPVLNVVDPFYCLPTVASADLAPVLAAQASDTDDCVDIDHHPPQHPYAVGYRQCADEIQRYLDEYRHRQLGHVVINCVTTSYAADDNLRQRLERHLGNCVSRMTFDDCYPTLLRVAVDNCFSHATRSSLKEHYHVAPRRSISCASTTCCPRGEVDSVSTDVEYVDSALPMNGNADVEKLCRYGESSSFVGGDQSCVDMTSRGQGANDEGSRDVNHVPDYTGKSRCFETCVDRECDNDSIERASTNTGRQHTRRATSVLQLSEDQRLPKVAHILDSFYSLAPADVWRPW